MIAAAATTATAIAARAVDIPLEVAGEQIPLAGFAQLTLFATTVGLVLAVLSRRARHPRRAFVRTALALTVLSLVPDILIDTGTASKVVLALTHLVAAAIVVPVLAKRLAD